MTLAIIHAPGSLAGVADDLKRIDLRKDPAALQHYVVQNRAKFTATGSTGEAARRAAIDTIERALPWPLTKWENNRLDEALRADSVGGSGPTFDTHNRRRATMEHPDLQFGKLTNIMLSAPSHAAAADNIRRYATATAVQQSFAARMKTGGETYSSELAEQIVGRDIVNTGAYCAESQRKMINQVSGMLGLKAPAIRNGENFGINLPDSFKRVDMFKDDADYSNHKGKGVGTYEFRQKRFRDRVWEKTGYYLAGRPGHVTGFLRTDSGEVFQVNFNPVMKLKIKSKAALLARIQDTLPGGKKKRRSNPYIKFAEVELAFKEPIAEHKPVLNRSPKRLGQQDEPIKVASTQFEDRLNSPESPEDLFSKDDLADLSASDRTVPAEALPDPAVGVPAAAGT